MRTNTFAVILTRDAKKDIKDLKAYAADATREVFRLEKDPHLGHTLEGILKHARSLVFSLPGGAYRATYVPLYREHIWLVFLVGPHEGFYKIAERRYKALRKQGRV